MKHPNFCYSHDMNNNCTIIKWGEPGYYKTDYPEGGYTDEVIDEMNLKGGITPEQRKAMELCSIASQQKHLNWESHYALCMRILTKKGRNKK